MGRVVKRGDVRWYNFAQPDQRRPVLILTRDSIIPYLGEAMVAPITRTIRDSPSEVIIGRGDGMPDECAVNCDHLQTVPQHRIGALITTLSSKKMSQAARSIQVALNLA